MMVAVSLKGLSDWLVFVGLVIGGTWLTPLRRPFKWLLRVNVTEPLARWFRQQVSEELEPTAHLVKYHLGSNGTTRPMHLRITDLEDALTEPEKKLKTK